MRHVKCDMWEHDKQSLLRIPGSQLFFHNNVNKKYFFFDHCNNIQRFCGPYEEPQGSWNVPGRLPKSTSKTQCPTVRHTGVCWRAASRPEGIGVWSKPNSIYTTRPICTCPLPSYWGWTACLQEVGERDGLPLPAKTGRARWITSRHSNWWNIATIQVLFTLVMPWKNLRSSPTVFFSDRKFTAMAAWTSARRRRWKLCRASRTSTRGLSR